jgi:hypothetical protein
MTKDEALKLALSALDEVRQETFRLMKDSQTLYSEKKVWEAIYTIKKVLAQPQQDNTYAYASSLAKTIWQKHYIKESPKFALLDTTEGVLTQIDNMTCGLVREKPAQPKQEPIGYVSEGAAERLTTVKQAHEQIRSFRLFTHDVPLYTNPPQRPWVGLTDEEIKAFDTWHDNREEEVGWCNPSEIVAYIEAKLRSKNT